MSEDTFPEGHSTLAEQATVIIDEETDWVTLAQELNVSRYKCQDNHPDWHSGTPFEPMFLAYLWSTVEGYSLTGVPNRLSTQPTLARTFGFDPANLPSDSTFRPCRVHSRFEALEATVKMAAEQIRNIAAERGAPIGFQFGRTKSTTDKNPQPSERTIDRLLRKRGREALDELKTVALPSLSLPRPEGAVYDEQELLALEAVAALHRSAANGAGKELGDAKNPHPDLDDPFYEDGPTGEVLLEAMKEMSVDQIGKMMNFALQKTYTRKTPAPATRER